MKAYTVGPVLMVVGIAGVVGLGAVEERLAVDAMVDASEAFLSSLSADQRARATFDFDSPERLRHHFIPTEVWERNGLQIKEMTAEQEARAQDLLRAGLSARGHRIANEIIEAEGILGRMEGDDRQFARDPEDYWVSVFGTPSSGGTWGWRFEGHHLSLHFTVVEGELTVSTPTFLGANPAEVPEGLPREGLRPLREHEDRARALLRSLDAEQREAAIFDDVAPQNVVTGAELQVDPLEPAGVRAADLGSSQRRQLLSVIEAYTSMMADDIAELRRAEIRAGGVDDLTFAWAGGTERGDVSYYRIQGPTFLLEFDFTQEDPNHIHAAWRDFDGDLGRDLLREHLTMAH